MISGIRNGRVKGQHVKFGIFAIALLTAFLFTTNIRTTSQYDFHSKMADRASQSFRGFRDSAIQQLKSINVFSEETTSTKQPLISHHPFDNKCKFPIPNIYAEDINTARLSERLRHFKCNVTIKDYASMDSEGFLYVHPHMVDYPRVENDVTCKIVIIDGGLRIAAKNWTKNEYYEIKTSDAVDNTRTWVNADAFLVRCFNNSKEAKGAQIYEKSFPGMRDRNIPENEIILEKDLPSYGLYGNELRGKPEPVPDRYSIDILGFDSTARTMFMRHLPRSVETMKKLGYHFLFGYTKVADNSMVNLAPILVGDMKEALAKPKTDASGDLNIDWILPTHDRLDPTKLEFLWKVMKEKYGCESLFNEDISMAQLGLFNYPNHEFQPGFTERPADHYYRAYYLAVYKKWKYEQCKDGEQIQDEFVKIWKRFATKYKNICHFGFTFVTTLTHEAGFMLELLDEKLSAHISELYIKGALDNTMSVIMGDHGNRIGAVQMRYTGRIEERMPLMAIRLPTGFEQNYPEEYKNFIDNKYKLTSNFDIHKTLNDIVTMHLGSNKADVPPDTGRGISLFDTIPSDRTCADALVPENFCMCMVDVSKVENPLPKVKKIPDDTQKKDQFETFKKWLKEENLDKCIQIGTLEQGKRFDQMAINHYCRMGLRSKSNLTVNAEINKKSLQLNYLNYEFEVTGTYKDDQKMSLLVRTEHFMEKATNRLVFEPYVQIAPDSCNYSSLYDVCDCLDSLSV